MLVLTFRAGAHRYALDAAAVQEVVPCVNFTRLAASPPWIDGVIAYRGVATPLIDFTRLLTGHPCPRRWSSRMMLVEARLGGLPDQLALLAERVATAEIDERALRAPAAAAEGLGPVLFDAEGALQLVDLSRLLAAAQRLPGRPLLTEEIA